MTEFTQTAAGWGLHTAAAGVAVFGLGWAWVRRVSDPARRQLLAGWVVRGGLLAAVLCLLPAWLILPAPRWAAPRSTPTAEAALPPLPEAPTAVTPDPPQALTGEMDAPPAGMWVLIAPAPTPANPDRVRANPERERGGEPATRNGTPHGNTDQPPEGVKPNPVADGDPLRGYPGSPEPAAPTPFNPWPGIARLALLAYGVGLVVAVVPLLLGSVALARLRRSGSPAPADVRAVFDEVAAGCGVRPRLLVSDRVGSPVCFGLLRPVVVLPRKLAAAADAAELRWVFAHELDHLRRGDPWTGWWVGLARAVYFFVPWFWRVKHDLQLTQEILADAAAAAAGGRAEDYAAFLVRLSGSPAGRRHPVGAAAVRAGRKSDLFWRVTMLLASKDRTAPRASRRWSAGVAGLTVGVAVLVSGVGFAGPVRPDDPKAKPAEAPRGGAVPNTKKADDKKPAEAKPADGKKPEFDSKDVRVGPPPELAALRAAVEDAAKKGENVDEIRKQLDSLEKALTGKAWVRPRPQALAPVPPVPGVPPVPPVPPVVRPGGLAPVQPNMQLQFGRGGALVAPPGAWNPLFPGGGDGRLGVRISAVPDALADQLDLPKGQGVVITEVVKGSAAEKAGLKPSDVVLEFAGKPAPAEPAEFARAVRGVKKDEKVDIVVLRKGKKETIKGVELPEPRPDAGLPGLDLVPAVPGVDLFPVPAPPARGGRVEVRPGRVVVPPGGQRNTTELRVEIGAFNINSNEDGVTIQIEGKSDGGKAVPTRIRITDGDKKVEVESVDKVPAEYRDQVQKLLDGVRFAP